MADHQNWRIEIWGTRGSFPSVGPDFQSYGQHTSCISVDCGDTLAILDAGSGLAPLGEALFQRGQKRADIFLSHLHLDHVMGLFPFAPRCDRNFELHLYGTPETVRELPRLVGPPLWPVGLTNCQAKVCFHEMEGKAAFPLDGTQLTVTGLDGSHPGGCRYYRLEGNGRSLVYALDCELTGDIALRLTDFAHDTDLLIWDASFSPSSLKLGWGHSTWKEGSALGRAAGAKRVLMTHYSGEYNDIFLSQQEELARQTDSRVQFAREGMVIEL